jgi:hypothetical protein
MPQIQRGKQVGIAVGCHGVVSKGICTTDGYALINLDSVKLSGYFDSVKITEPQPASCNATTHRAQAKAGDS